VSVDRNMHTSDNWLSTRRVATIYHNMGMGEQPSSAALHTHANKNPTTTLGGWVGWRWDDAPILLRPV
jgi:hypothetical protein